LLLMLFISLLAPFFVLDISKYIMYYLIVLT